ncbi:response regulator [bacterium]|nr:response regulator [bacterium]
MEAKIMFVDDESNVLDGLRRMLLDQENDWKLEFVTDPNEALKRLKSSSYDVVVSDIKMPEMDGLTLLSAIRHDRDTTDTEVIILTGLQERDLKRRALDLGAADLLNKPIIKEDLTARLQSVLRMKQFRDSLKTQNMILERELQQSQKMEVVGTIASGISHDLANILTIIVGFSDLMKITLVSNPKAEKDMNRISKAAIRARNLVGQIRDFSRKVETVHESVELPALIDELVDLLRCSVAKKYSVIWEGSSSSGRLFADATQIYQMLMNLCINGLQAMDEGGTLSLSLEEMDLHDESQPELRDLTPGPYFHLMIKDEGKGMNRVEIDQIFDFSLSTKSDEGGNGVGLFVAKRIVESHCGGICVESQTGAGTIFHVYLPCAG